MSEKNKFWELRTKAEKLLKQKGQPGNGAYLEDVENLVEELSILQIELEIQNEELRTSQIEIEKSRQKYSELFNYAPVGYFILNRLSNIIDVNQTGCTMLHIKKDLLLAKPLMAFIHKDYKTIFYKHIKKTFESERIQECEIRIDDLEKQTHYLHLQSVRYLDKPAGQYLCRTSARDITEQKTAEKKYEASRKKLEHISDVLFDFVYELQVENHKGQILWYTGALETITGYTIEEINALEHGFFSVIHPDDRSMISGRNYDELLKNGFCSNEYRIIAKDGREKWVLDKIKPSTFTSPKNGHSIIGAIEDVSKRKEFETGLRLNEEKFRTLFNSASDSIFIHNLNGKFLEVNEAACKKLGYDREEMMQLTPANIDSPEFAEKVPERIELLKQKGQFIFETGHLSKDNKYFPIELSSKVINFNGAKAVLSIARDITERKNAQRNIIESKQRYKSLFDNSLTGIIYFNTRGDILEANSKVIEMLGSPSAEETKKINILKFKPLIDIGASKQFLECIKKGKPVFKEAQYTSKWGKTLYVRYYFNPIYDNDGIIIGLLANLDDISEQTIANKKLRESEEKFRKVIEQSVDGIVLCNQNGEIIEWNKGKELISGIPKQEALGKYIWDVQYKLTPPKHRDEKQLEKVVNETKKALLTGESDIFYTFKDQEIEHRTEGKKIIQSVMFPLKIGGVNFIGSIIRDVTEQKMSESSLKEALHDLEMHQKEIVNLLNASKAVLQFKKFNQAAEVIFNACRDAIDAEAGYVALLNKEGSENDVVYLNPGNLPCDVDENLPMPIRGLRAEAYKEKRAVYDNNYEQSAYYKYMPPGHARLYNVMFAPLILNNKAVGLLGLGNKPGGFTERDKRVAAAFAEFAAIALNNSQSIELLEKRAAELDELNATKDKFFSIIAHDLKNPFGNVLNFSKLIYNNFPKYNKDKLRIFIKSIYESAQSTYDLLENLLHWSRIQMNKIQLSPETISLKEISENSLRTLRHQANAKNIFLRSDIPDNFTVYTDPNTVNTVIRNLVSNALKFTKPEGEVTIFAYEKDNKIEIGVRDTGIGMTQEEIDKIFRLDVNFSRTGTAKESGTGLGLILCKELVEKNGGEIHVKSKPGEGSNFCFTLMKGRTI